MTVPTWTDHEQFLADALACRVKVARYDQLQAVWSLSPCGRLPFALDEALIRLAWAIECYTVNLHPPLRPIGPVLTLQPGEPSPADLRPHSELLRHRWNQAAVPTTVYVATKAAANLFGSTAGGLPQLGHRDHDVLLADAYLHHLRADRRSIHEWVGEQMIKKAGYRIKDPDAFRVGADGTPYKIVESGGAYSAGQLQGLCDWAIERGLALEVW